MKDNRPETAAEAAELANAPRAYWYTASSGRVELAITWDDASSGCQPGRDATEAVTELESVPYIAEQLDHAGMDAIRDELRGYGAWDAAQLEDDAENRLRILWIACGDISENFREQTP